MAVRALWKGHLRLSLVTIPVRVYPATNASGTVHFHQLHRKCKTRIQYKKWCPHCDEEVTNEDIVKGYEFERGQFVPIEEEELAKVRPESTRVIQLTQFADDAALDPMLIDEPYFLAPDGKVAAQSFAVLRDALEGTAAIGSVAFHGRERLVAVESKGAGMIMFTLRQQRDVRKMSAIGDLAEVPKRANAAEVALAKKLIGGFEHTIDFSQYHDTYEEALRKMIDAKIAGDKIIAPKAEAPPKVVNLMDALRKSLERVSQGKKAPARTRAKARGKAAPVRKVARGRVSKFPVRRGA